MGPPRRGHAQRRREAPRYREAAEAALEMLDWLVSYFHQIRKSNIAEALQKNRREILRRLKAG